MKKCLAILVLTLAAGAENVPLADFSKGTDGFGGAFRHRVENGRGAAFLENTDQRWVEGAKDIEAAPAREVQAIRFDVRSDTIGRVAARLVDASGQTFLHRLAFEPDGQWHTLAVTDLAKANETWGGANDKRFHPQIKTIGFTLEGRGLVAFDNVGLVLSDKPFIPDLAWDLAPGHIFDTPANVAIPIRSSRASIEWEVTDFWRGAVDKGTLVPANGAGVIKPAIQAPGYYLLRLGEKTFVSLAVVPPFAPKDRENSPYGVMTHFAQHMSTDILPLLHRIGITSIRDEHYWKNVETQKGVHAFSEKSDAWMAAAKALDLHPVVPMTFENPLHDGGKTPHTPEGCDAYGDYGAAMLRQYPQIKWLEVWNEYNGSWCDGPAAADRPRYYAQMLKHAHAKIKAERPDVLVLGCAPVLFPIPYMEGIFRHGGLQNLDAVVIHPYRYLPEGVEDELAELEALIRQYNDGQPKPIWATEIGRYDHSEAPWEGGQKMYEAGRAQVARYLPRMYALLLMSPNVQKIHWYLCRDYMDFTTMGLLRRDNDPMGRYAVAPAYAAFATLIRQLDQPRFVRRADLGRFTHALLFETSGGPVWMCWATQPATIAFNANGPRTVIDIVGAEHAMTPLNNQITLSLGEDVVYYRGNDEPSATPGLAVTADPRAPVLGAPVFNAGPAGAGLTLKTRGQTLRLDPNGQAALPVDTSAPRAETLEYQFLSPRGSLVARGAIRHETVESLAFLPQSIQAWDAQTLFAQIENTLPNAPAFQLRDVGWKLGDDRPAAIRQHVELPAGNLLSLRFDGAGRGLEPYRRADLEITARFENRADLAWRGSVAYNPCFKTGAPNAPAISLDAHGQRWGASQNCGIQVEARYDDAALRLKFTNTAKDILVGVASSDNSVWHVLRLATGTLKSEHASGAAPVADIGMSGDAFQLPWAALGLPAPKHGAAFRLAIAASDSRGAWEWGAGLYMGRTPSGFNLCRFVDPDAAVETGPPVLAVAPAPAKPAPLSPGRVLTDSEADYGKEQGLNNHWYGFYPEKKYTPAGFTEMEHVQTIWGYNWAAKSGYQHMQLSPRGGHPGEAGGFPVWAVRRWKSAHSGPAQITGTLRANDDKGDGVGLRVLVDGIQAANCLAGGEHPREISFELNVELGNGSLVDFALTPGPAANTFYDAATLTFKVRALEPVQNP